MGTVTILAILLSEIFVTIFGGSVPIKRKYGTLNPYFNQTAWGYFRIVVGSNEVSRVPSIWMQDDGNKRMRIDVGSRNSPGFTAEFYFFKDKVYEVFGGPNGPGGPNDAYHCKKVPDFNYSMEISTYGEPNFGFLGRHVLQEYNGITADVYVGQAVDGVGPLNCLFYCDSDGSKFLGLTCVGAANKFSFNEYWFGDNLTTVAPPDYWFTLPPECNNPTVEYFFDTHNTDGSPKKPTMSGSGSSSSSSSSSSSNLSTDYCAGSSNDVAMVLYRSMCCGLRTIGNNGGTGK